eukprot:1213553-Pyramimonas_sp.AAC.1
MGAMRMSSNACPNMPVITARHISPAQPCCWTCVTLSGSAARRQWYMPGVDARHITHVWHYR